MDMEANPQHYDEDKTFSWSWIMIYVPLSTFFHALENVRKES